MRDRQHDLSLLLGEPVEPDAWDRDRRARRQLQHQHLPKSHSMIFRSLHLRRTSARVVTSSPSAVQSARTSRSRPAAVKASEAIPARMRSAAAWTGSTECSVWNQSGSRLAGKVIGENSRTKNTSTWETSWASIAGRVTAIAYPTAVAIVVTSSEARSSTGQSNENVRS